jgi:hypothetical protein
MFTNSSSLRRRSAFRPELEAIERRELLSVASVTPVGDSTLPAAFGVPVTPQFQILVRGQSKVVITDLLYQEGRKFARYNPLPPVKFTHSGKNILIANLPKVKFPQVGTYIVSFKIGKQSYEFLQRVTVGGF